MGIQIQIFLTLEHKSLTIILSSLFLSYSILFCSFIYSEDTYWSIYSMLWSMLVLSTDSVPKGTKSDLLVGNCRPVISETTFWKKWRKWNQAEEEELWHNSERRGFQPISFQFWSWMALQSCPTVWPGVWAFVLSSTNHWMRASPGKGTWWGRCPSTKDNDRKGTQVTATARRDASRNTQDYLPSAHFSTSGEMGETVKLVSFPMVANDML